jgi:hypothetical protein
MLNTPRNVGFTKIGKDLKTRLSKGPKEKGGFYTFGGNWQDLENEGIQWVTNFDESLSRLKVIKNGSGYLLLAEVWSPENYMHTVILNTKDGLPVDQPQDLCYPLRLLRTDEPNGDLMVTGEGSGKIATYQFIFE